MEAIDARENFLDVVAEGCETAEQLAFLQQRNCDLVQGYYLSRPVAANQFADGVREVHG